MILIVERGEEEKNVLGDLRRVRTAKFGYRLPSKRTLWSARAHQEEGESRESLFWRGREGKGRRRKRSECPRRVLFQFTLSRVSINACSCSTPLSPWLRNRESRSSRASSARKAMTSRRSRSRISLSSSSMGSSGGTIWSQSTPRVTLESNSRC